MVRQLIKESWLKSSRELLLTSQNTLLRSLVQTELTDASSDGINAVKSAAKQSGETVVLAHGFGSGLGFFYKNVDPIYGARNVKQVYSFDWLGMGGSRRPDCREAPRVPLLPCCNSKFTTPQAVGFFVDSFEKWCETQNLTNFTLVGHSLGGYLSARYVMKYPKRVRSLVLASPVGIATKPLDALPRNQVEFGLRLIDVLWSANFTPQQIVRMLGYRRGFNTVNRVLQARIQGLGEQDVKHLSEYLYHITVAEPSGEFAMNSLLLPVRSPSTVGVFAKEPLQPVLPRTLSRNLESLRIVFGDHDWMRRNNDVASQEIIDELRSGGSPIDAKLTILDKAGHHLYMDNQDGFHREILETI